MRICARAAASSPQSSSRWSTRYESETSGFSTSSPIQRREVHSAKASVSSSEFNEKLQARMQNSSLKLNRLGRGEKSSADCFKHFSGPSFKRSKSSIGGASIFSICIWAHSFTWSDVMSDADHNVSICSMVRMEFFLFACFVGVGVASDYQSSFTAITASLPAAARPASHAVTVPDTTTAAHSAHKRGAGMFISIVQ